MLVCVVMVLREINYKTIEVDYMKTIIVYAFLNLTKVNSLSGQLWNREKYVELLRLAQYMYLLMKFCKSIATALTLN
jgi:phage terminase Nu1 subunit (DNA packaging protein)